MKKIVITSVLFLSLVWGTSCQRAMEISLSTPPGNPTEPYASIQLVNPENTKSVETALKTGEDELILQLRFPQAKAAFTPSILYYDRDNEQGPVNKIVQKYADYKQLRELNVLDTDYYSITADPVSEGQSATNVKLNILKYDEMPYGNYIIPVVVSLHDELLVQFVSLIKDGEYVRLSEETPKPLPPGTDIQRPMKMIAFVETNDWDIRNYGQLILKDSKQPVFDIVVLFAANMNYDGVTGQRYISFNDKLKPIIEHPEIYIKPLKDRGITVLIDILPNHQGVGYRNFQTYEEALAFAREAKELAEQIGIDGWDMDEEYADYYKLPSKPRNAQSGMWFVKAMKELMPDKLLTLYEFGFPSGDYSKYVDYSWANYGEAGSYYGIPDDKHSKYSVEANWGLWGAENSARYNVRDKSLGLMFFNINPHTLANGSGLPHLSRATQLFYGQDCVFSGAYFKGPKDY